MRPFTRRFPDSCGFPDVDLGLSIGRPALISITVSRRIHIDCHGIASRCFFAERPGLPPCVAHMSWIYSGVRRVPGSVSPIVSVACQSCGAPPPEDIVLGGVAPRRVALRGVALRNSGPQSPDIAQKGVALGSCSLALGSHNLHLGVAFSRRSPLACRSPSGNGLTSLVVELCELLVCSTMCGGVVGLGPGFLARRDAFAGPLLPGLVNKVAGIRLVRIWRDTIAQR